MADYVCIVQAPSNEPPLAVGTKSPYPMVIPVPPPALIRGIDAEASRRNEESLTEHPEKWMVANVLPNHPGSSVTLYKSVETYEPSTHKKRGE